MPDADITKRPSSNVTGLSAPKRGSSGSYTFSSTWKNPSAITSSSRDDRATHVGLYWWVDPKDDAKMKKYEIHRDFTIGTTTDSLNLNDFWANEYVNNKLSKSNVHCARTNFYPHTGTKVERISLVTIAWNPVGVASTPWPTQYAWIKPPRKPSITVPTHAADTGVISATIATNAGQDLQERYDTRYQVTVYDSRTGKTTTQTDTSSTATSVTATYNATDRFNLGYSNFLKVTFKAWARGLAGDSATVTRTHVVAWPAQATIKKVSYSSTSGSGLCTVSIATNNNAEKHPVDGCKLQMLRNTSITSASAASSSSDWVDVGAEDDASCTALACSVGSIVPDAGLVTWLRVRTWHDVPDTMYRDSNPVRCTALETAAPTAADDTVTILSAEPNVDGTQAVIVLGHKNDDSDETELSWAKDYHAWKSNEQPETFMVTWDDNPRASYGNASTWPKTQTITVKGLDGGVPYFFRARRHSSATSVFGALCNLKKVTPQTAPGSAYLSAPAFAKAGSSIAYAWSVSADKRQTAWRLMSGTKILVSGSGSATSHVLSASNVKKATTNGVCTVHVAVAAGGDFTNSNDVSTVIATQPTLSVSTASTMTAQPLTLAFTTNTAAGTLNTTVSAVGCSGDSPSGRYEQLPGDVVWTDSRRPAWTKSGSTYTASITLPRPLEFHNGATYEVTANVTDPTTGLVSDDASAQLVVNYSHAAPTPPSSVTVTPSDTTDASGVRTLAADIYLPAATGAASTDVYDVYRETSDGYQLAASGIASGSTITDPYAPFGDGSYRVACRTQDGDVQWMDYPYSLHCGLVRIDWDGGYVELPYNLQLGDAYGKDFEARRHLDGSVSGYWNDGASRQSSVTTDIVRDVDSDTLSRLRALAVHPGPAYIRMPGGDAFQANVTVDGINNTYSSTAVAVSIKAERVELTSEFAIDTNETGE